MGLKTYFDEYKKLKEKYKIHYGLTDYNKETRITKNINLDDYDIIVKEDFPTYACRNFQIIKNKPNLSALELAIICDEGNLCFGYRGNQEYITVYTD